MTRPTRAKPSPPNEGRGLGEGGFGRPEPCAPHRSSASPLTRPLPPSGGEERDAATDPFAAATEAARLDPARTLAAIRAAAEQRRCLSYADVAAASFLPWRAARRQMDPHLFKLCADAQARGWPLLSAIVVNRHLVPDCRMEGRALAGFTAMVARLGVGVGTDPAAFLKREQDAVFHWAEKERGRDLHH